MAATDERFARAEERIRELQRRIEAWKKEK